ncbi:MAG: hypothetical protein VYA34_00905 [Myxococcota bacterium]|nr:hypothetical protein [Myxococcota bacterium]
MNCHTPIDRANPHRVAIESKENYLYHPYYCEENIWQLLANPRFNNTPAWVAFVTNPKRSVYFFQQRAGQEPSGFVLWDYHILALTFEVGHWWVWDFDSLLPFPCPWTRYLEFSWAGQETLPSDVHPMIRFTPRDIFLENFASSREHMKDETGKFIQPPPPWEPIQTPNNTNNLNEWLCTNTPSQTQFLRLGDLKTLDQLSKVTQGPKKTSDP